MEKAETKNTSNNDTIVKDFDKNISTGQPEFIYRSLWKAMLRDTIFQVSQMW